MTCSLWQIAMASGHDAPTVVGQIPTIALRSRIIGILGHVFHEIGSRWGRFWPLPRTLFRAVWL